MPASTSTSIRQHALWSQRMPPEIDSFYERFFMEQGQPTNDYAPLQYHCFGTIDGIYHSHHVGLLFIDKKFV